MLENALLSRGHAIVMRIHVIIIFHPCHQAGSVVILYFHDKKNYSLCFLISLLTVYVCGII